MRIMGYHEARSDSLMRTATTNWIRALPQRCVPRLLRHSWGLVHVQCCCGMMHTIMRAEKCLMFQECSCCPAQCTHSVATLPSPDATLQTLRQRQLGSKRKSKTNHHRAILCSLPSLRFTGQTQHPCQPLQHSRPHSNIRKSPPSESGVRMFKCQAGPSRIIV